ncbi:hypothetical protein AGOR_G00179910 [Albula goreensis]|uniref:LEM domain-containing protein n=1 Tax=Albula goreensis TaxID=1534307 RepID=A0A8T3CRN1_9TELE|nr:hypothetical protein AGOR_G00179910 [Albula goreensis]
MSDVKEYSCPQKTVKSQGPVTENTRPVYLKKRKKLREDHERGTWSGKIHNSGIINANSGSTAAGGAGFAAWAASNDVRYLRTGLSPSSLRKKRTNGGSKFVLGFSSDESDAEVTQSLHHSDRRERGSGRLYQQVHHPQELTATSIANTRSHSASTDISSQSFGVLVRRRLVSGSPSRSNQGIPSIGSSQTKDGRGSGNSDDEDYGQRQIVTDVHAGNGSRSSYPSDSSKFRGHYSDSEEEEEEIISTKQRDRRLSSRRRHPKSPLSPHRSSIEVESSQENARCGVIKINDKDSARILDLCYDRSEEECARNTDQEESTLTEGLRNSGYTRKLGSVSATLEESIRDGRNCRPPACTNHVNLLGGGSDTGNRLSAGVNPHFYSNSNLSATYCLNHLNNTAANNHHTHIPARQSGKLAVPEEELLQQFKRDEFSGTGGFSAHYLSMLLLVAACLFFVLLGLMYLRMRGSGSLVTVVMRNHPFGIEFDNTHVGEEKDLILNVLLHLHDHLANIAGKHDCGDHGHYPSRSLSLAEATDYLMLHSTDYKHFVLPALEWIIRTGEDVGIWLIGSNSEEPVTEVSEVKRLESTHPKMSFICRFQRAFLTVIYRVLLFLTGIGIVWPVVYYMKSCWRKEEEETRQMYDLVERIIDVLRSHSAACLENKDLQPYLPIPHVKDSLVQPQDRKKMKKAWDRAVAFLSVNESHIQTETQRIQGADFLVWRWIQPSPCCDSISAVPSKVWQGKAIQRWTCWNSPPNSLTPCLKIRNMFDPVMEVGEDWHLAIHEAILEKCSDNDGIVHIAVDKNSREGCVYVKCLSADQSGKAFKALHGSWFDGKLVTVKYLRLDRYHERFPQALGCSTPLKPSSKDMNTLAHLHHHGNAGNAQGPS